MPDLAPLRRALISVSDKTGLAELGQALSKRGVEILSTGGSAATLRASDGVGFEVPALTLRAADGCLARAFPLVSATRA